MPVQGCSGLNPGLNLCLSGVARGCPGLLRVEPRVEPVSGQGWPGLRNLKTPWEQLVFMYPEIVKDLKIQEDGALDGPISPWIRKDFLRNMVIECYVNYPVSN